MLAEIKRFHAEAIRLLETSGDDCETLGSFVDRHHFSRYFIDYFMTPLVAAVWSCPPGEAMRYPARYLFVFLEHHGMLSVFGSPTWRTVTGGSANYVEPILTRIDEVAAGIPVRSVQRVGEGVLVTVGSGRPRLFDAAVIATIRSGAADARRADRCRTSGAGRNSLLAPTGHSCTPTNRCCRGTNGHGRRGTTGDPDRDDVLVTYDVTRLMRLAGRATSW